MAQSLADRLEAARREQFVGRSQERDLLRNALQADDLPFSLFYVYGPGGVGKTSLLREAAQIAGESETAVYWLDARNLEPSPAGFMAGLAQAVGVSDSDTVFSALADHPGRVLLLIDTAELLAPIESWLQDVFLPRLPGSILVVIAGRNPPSIRWRSDLGWQEIMRLLPLENLDRAESSAFLNRRQVPPAQHEAILQFTHGHPLALSLVADLYRQQPGLDFLPENSPDIIKSLLEQFMQEAPGPNHRAALEACSQVRLLSEPLLAEILKVDDPHPIFDWLRGLSFIESERRGLYPHDLAREALAVDLRWRDPVRQAQLHAQARAFYMQRFQEGSFLAQQQVLNDYIFLHRDNPIIRGYFDWQSTGTIFADNYHVDDREGLLAMVRRHEGPLAERIAEHWFIRQPQGTMVIRKSDRTAQGLLQIVVLETCNAEDRQLDPAVDAVWQALSQLAPLRSGEGATLFRFWMADGEYQQTSTVQSRIFVSIVQHFLTQPGLVYSFLPCAHPDYWGEFFQFADQQRLPEADFVVDGRSYGVFFHNWGKMPPMLWLAEMARRELTAEIGTAVEASLLPEIVVFDEESFATAVRDALRDYTNEVALQTNPLLQSQIVVSTVGPEADKAEQISQLQSLLAEAAQTMQAHPKQIKWYRALHHTYFQPAATQEQAAELLDLPFSTYRRHLRSGIQYITDWLWSREGLS